MLERKQPLFQQEAGLVLPFGVHVLWRRDVMASSHVVATQASLPGPTGLSNRSLHCCVEQRMGFVKGRVVGGPVSALPAWLVSPHSQRIRVPQFQGSLCFGVKLFNVTKHEFF